MGRANQDRDRFLFTYNGVTFDVIVELDKTPFEFLVGAVYKNWACTMKCEKGFHVSMENEDYYALCDILNLKQSSHKFNSNVFIKYMAEHCPNQCSGNVVDPKYMIRHIQKTVSSSTNEDDKTVFKGWNDHIKDQKKAHNFAKTQKYFGKNIAIFCERNNISSIWTTPEYALERKNGSYPPGYSGNHAK